MVNPELPYVTPQSVTWRQFELIWQPRGWALYTPPADAAASTTTDTAAPDGPADTSQEN